MKEKLIITLATILLISCNEKTQLETSFIEQRAETDTIISFQGIKVSEPLDSALYSELVNNCPIVLYNKSKKALTFTEIVINGEYDPAFPGDITHSVSFDEDTKGVLGSLVSDPVLGSFVIDPVTPGEIVHSLSLQSAFDNYLSIIDIISLYQEKYGSFSYYLRLKQEKKKMGSFPIGEMSEVKGRPYKQIDAFSDFVEYVKSTRYKFIFVWEWNNQSIVISYNPDESELNTTISYLDTGYATRHAEEELEKAQKEEDERRIEEAYNHQQI